MSDYKIEKDFGIIAEHEQMDLYLRLTSWFDKPAKYDLRAYDKKGEPLKGMLFDETEIKQIGKLILQKFPEIDDSKKEEIEIIEHKDIVVEVEEQPKKRGRKAKAKVETKEEKPKKENKKIVQFPKTKPEIKKVITEGNATYEECETKLNEERKIFKDQDSQYVIDGLLELCKVDADFRNNVMRKDKTYAGSFEYFAGMAQKGYAIKYGNCTYLDNDLALGYAIDYFNS